MTPEYIKRVGIKVSAGLPLTAEEQAILDELKAPAPYLQDLTFVPAESGAYRYEPKSSLQLTDPTRSNCERPTKMQPDESLEEKMVQLPRLERGTPRSTICESPSVFSGSWRRFDQNPIKTSHPQPRGGQRGTSLLTTPCRFSVPRDRGLSLEKEWMMKTNGTKEFIVTRASNGGWVVTCRNGFGTIPTLLAAYTDTDDAAKGIKSLMDKASLTEKARK